MLDINDETPEKPTPIQQLQGIFESWYPPEDVTFEINGYKITVEKIVNETVISFIEQATINGINGGQPIDCKIDTGADMCSLHATNINVQGNDVSFSFNNRNYRMALAGKQDVKQAGSDPVARPIISITITIKDQTLQNVECNLSDRTDMTPLLLGKNALVKQQFTIDTQSEATNGN